MLNEKTLGISGIAIKPERLRSIQPAKVAELAASMAKLGQLQPIIAQPVGKADSGNGYWLIAGRHRLEAAKQLKWQAIRATVLEDVKADMAELIEIDENLIRAELTPAEEAMHIGRRKELYEKLYPETKHGAAPGKAGGGKKAKGTKLGSFATATAKATGQSKTKIKRDAKRAKDLGDRLNRINGTSLDTGVEMDALAKLPEEEQEALVARAETGEKVSAKAELAAKKSGAKPEPLKPDQIKALKALRKRADNLGYLAGRRDNGELYLTSRENNDVINCNGLDDVAHQLDIIESAQPAPVEEPEADEASEASGEEVTSETIRLGAAYITDNPRILRVFIDSVGAARAEAFARAILAELGVDAEVSTAPSDAPVAKALKPGEALRWDEFAPAKEDGGRQRAHATPIPNELDYLIAPQWNADGEAIGYVVERRTYKKNGDFKTRRDIAAGDITYDDAKAAAQRDFNEIEFRLEGGAVEADLAP